MTDNKETNDEPEADDFPAGWVFGYPDDWSDRVRASKIRNGLLDPNLTPFGDRTTDHKTTT